MFGPLRIAVSCLLALALPMQGIAAVGSLDCAAHHRHAASDRRASYHAPADRAQFPSHDSRHTHAAHVNDSHADTRAAAAARAAHVELPASPCAGCGGCCMNTAVPVSLPLISAARLTGSLPPSEMSQRPGFIPDGLYHPPRIPLA